MSESCKIEAKEFLHIIGCLGGWEGDVEKLRIKIYQLPTTKLFQGCVGGVDSSCL